VQTVENAYDVIVYAEPFVKEHLDEGFGIDQQSV